MYQEIIRVSLLGTSAYALYLSSTAGTLLNGYLSMSKKAAKVSNTAAKELQDTQRTVGLAVLTSIFSAMSTVYIWWLPGWTVYVSLFNTLLGVLAHRMIHGYWKDNTPTKEMKKMPGVADYSIAWNKMISLQKVVIFMAGQWTLMTMMASPNAYFKGEN